MKTDQDETNSVDSAGISLCLPRHTGECRVEVADQDETNSVDSAGISLRLPRDTGECRVEVAGRKWITGKRGY